MYEILIMSKHFALDVEYVNYITFKKYFQILRCNYYESCFGNSRRFKKS